ncbi:MAG TPA: AI-2E family transporter [Trueperaceae bacterium]|nr:AI-2E family transporter [Trueperaceae bacterium]
MTSETDYGTFLKRTFTVLGLVVLVSSLALLLWLAPEIFLLAFAGVLLAVFLNTPARFLADKTGTPHGLALAATVAFLLALVVAAAWLAGPRLVEQVRQLIQQLPSGLEQVRSTVSTWPGGEWLLARLGTQGEATSSNFNLVSRVTGTAAVVWDGVAKLVFVLYLGLFLATAPRKYRDGVVSLFPAAHRTRAKEAFNNMGRALQGWLLGQLVAMVIVGLLTGIGLYFIGVPLALVLGIIAGLSEFVPIVGTLVGFVPAALLALSQGTSTLLWVLALFVVIQQLEGNVIVPLVQRRAVDLPPPLTIAAVFVAGAVFGPLGLLVATPLLAVGLVLVRMLYLRDTLGESVKLPDGE